MSFQRSAWVIAATFSLLFAGCHRDRSSKGSPSTAAPSRNPPTAVRFVDAASKAGLNYQWVFVGKRPGTILQTIGNGCAFLDYNNDGNLDILLVGDKLALYKGDGHGHFTDVTQQTGLDKLQGNFLGCAVGDYDNDGYDDIYLTAYRGGALLHNEGGKHFQDVTKQAGIAPQPWGTSAAFGDIDGTGRLSLYIGNYVDFGPKTEPQLCATAHSSTACGPIMYKPVRGVLYQNLGGGRFKDVTDAWNAGKTSGKVLGVAISDFDGSGRQSILLANDEVAGNLLKNNGGRFTEIGETSGTAFDAIGGQHGGMGVDWGDYDNDGRLDLAVMTYQHENKCVYHNDGRDLFSERSISLGIAANTAPNVAFGVKWLDADNDGWLDLLIANGHVEDNADAIDPTASYRQPTQFFYNERGQHFTNASAALIGPADRSIVGRGLAIGDYDNDGRIDALVVDSEGRPLLLHNETPQLGHWLEINLVGTSDNRDGVGSLITVEAGGQTQLRQCTTGGSYMSGSTKRVHIGLGAASKVESIAVHWPSGHIDRYANINANQIITLREGSPAVQRNQ
ncbi:MAG TPA: CRTAC1 family protein [Capsulimonadaceae bacterium]|nr:CRTAC1 family protein [Capsulimonadaceae bacterium]